MNQPLGSCHSHTSEVSSLAHELKCYHACRKATSNEDPVQLDTPANLLTTSSGDMHIEDPVPSDSNPVVDSDLFTEEYEGTAQTYGTGATFMDHLNHDQYASEHTNNLYYPFATREEWEMASFLLCSDLSMAGINKFLSLVLVSFNFKFSFHAQAIDNILVSCRLNNLDYPLQLQNSFVHMQKCFQRVLNDNANHGPQTTQ